MRKDMRKEMHAFEHIGHQALPVLLRVADPATRYFWSELDYQQCLVERTLKPLNAGRNEKVAAM
jgi:hypothetical protein